MGSGCGRVSTQIDPKRVFVAYAVNLLRTHQLGCHAPLLPLVKKIYIDDAHPWFSLIQAERKGDTIQHTQSRWIFILKGETKQIGRGSIYQTC
jgi:hypothetical protein